MRRRARLEDALGHALGDADLSLLPWSAAVGGYVDDDGRVVDLSMEEPNRAVTHIEQRGEPVAAIVHDAALLEDPGLVNAVIAAVRLTIDNEHLQTELQSKLAEVAACASADRGRRRRGASSSRARSARRSPAAARSDRPLAPIVGGCVARRHRCGGPPDPVSHRYGPAGGDRRAAGAGARHPSGRPRLWTASRPRVARRSITSARSARSRPGRRAVEDRDRNRVLRRLRSADEHRQARERTPGQRRAASLPTGGSASPSPTTASAAPMPSTVRVSGASAIGWQPSAVLSASTARPEEAHASRWSCRACRRS